MQFDRLAKMDPSLVPHGVRIPDYIFNRFVPYDHKLILDLGGGSGEIQEELGGEYNILSIDLNEHIVRQGLSLGRTCLEGNATRPIIPSFGREATADLMFHQVDAVIMKGLLCNIAGEDVYSVNTNVRLALLTANLYLRDEGVLIIGDILRVGESNPVLPMSFNHKDDYLEYKEKWRKRYYNNRKLGLPDGTFLVTSPGDQREWGSYKELREMRMKNDFERFARHFREREIRALVEQGRFSVEYWGVSACKTRSGNPLPEFVMVANPQR